MKGFRKGINTLTNKPTAAIPSHMREIAVNSPKGEVKKIWLEYSKYGLHRATMEKSNSQYRFALTAQPATHSRVVVDIDDGQQIVFEHRTGKVWLMGEGLNKLSDKDSSSSGDATDTDLSAFLEALL